MWIYKRCVLNHTPRILKKATELILGIFLYLYSLSIMEHIRALYPDKDGRYTGFWYADGKMMNQISACQLEVTKLVIFMWNYMMKI